MNDLDLDVGFHINDVEVEQSLDNTRRRIRETGEAARQQEGIIERLKRAIEIYQRGITTATLEENIEKYNNRLREAQTELSRLNALGQQNSVSTARNFNGLQNSINQISRELPAFTYSAQTGFLAISNNIPILIDELGRLRTANAALSASGQSTVPIWRQLLSGLLSWGTALSLGVTLLTVYGKEIGNFIVSIFKGKDALEGAKKSLQALNEVMKDANKDAGKELTTLNILYKAATDVTNSTKNRTAAAQELKKEFPDAFANSKTQAILNGEEKKTFDELSKSIYENAKARAAASKIEKLAAEQLDAETQKEKIRNANTNEKAAFKKQYDANLKDNQAKAAKNPYYVYESVGTYNVESDARANNAIKVQDDIIKKANDTIQFLEKFAGGTNKIAEAISKGGDDANKAAERSFAEMLNSRGDVLNKLADLDAEYSRKSFDKNAEELQALKDKFTQFRRTLSEENDKITKYNQSHDRKVSLIDIAQVDPIEQRATSDLKYKQDTEQLKTAIGDKKKLYADYEAYKLKAGSTAADAEYADLLQSGKDFAAYLDNIKNAVDSSDQRGVVQERLAAIQKATDDNVQLQKRAFEQLLQSGVTYQQERQAIIEAGIDAENKLRAAGYEEQAEQAIQNANKRLTELDEAKVKELTAYKEVFDGIHQLTVAQATNDIAALQNYIDAALKAGIITKEAYDAINKQLSTKGLEIKNQLPEELKIIGQGLASVSSLAGSFSDGLSKALSTAASLVTATGEMKENLNTLNSDSASSISKISAGFGLIGSAIGVVTTIAGLFDHSKEQAEQQKYTNELQLKATEAINKELERQLKLTEQIYGPERIAAYTKQLNDITAAQAAANDKLKGRYGLTTGVKWIDDEIADRNNGARGINIYDSIIKGVEELGQAVDLSKLSLEQLQKLMDEGKLDSTTAGIVQSLLDLQQQAIDTRNALNETLTGTTFDAMLDGVLNLFSDTTTAAEDWGNNLTKIIQTSLLNSFKSDFLAPQIQKLYDYIAELTKKDGGTLTKDSIAKIKNMYDGIIADGEKKISDLETATGVSLDDPTKTDDSNSLKGAYKTASQASIDLLSANTGGLRLAAVEGNNLLKANNATMADGIAEIKKQTLSLMEISVNTKVTADYAPYLKNLEDINKKMDNNGNYLQGTGRGG